MSEKKPSTTAEQARICMEQAVHDELVKKAKLGQDVIISRDGEPYKMSAAEALRVQEASSEYKADTEK